MKKKVRYVAESYAGGMVLPGHLDFQSKLNSNRINWILKKVRYVAESYAGGMGIGAVYPQATTVLPDHVRSF